MAIVTLQQVKDELAFTSDMGSVDDAILNRKIDAAQDHVESMLGYKIEDRYNDSPPEIPASIIEAVIQLAAYWYDSDPVANEKGAKTLPFGFASIIDSYRDRSF